MLIFIVISLFVHLFDYDDIFDVRSVLKRLNSKLHVTLSLTNEVSKQKRVKMSRFDESHG